MITRTPIRASVAAALAFVVFLGVMATKGLSRPAGVQKSAVPAVSTDDLAAAADAKVFFDHQSVGMNVVDGIPDVYAAADTPPPEIVELSARDGAATPTTLRSRTGGYFAHAFFGQNGDPVAKIEDFDARIRGGLGREVDVAFMKFCYIDVDSDTDVDALFTRYRDTMSALERDFPNVTFLKVTTPVTTERGLKSRVKALLGRDDHMGPADNAARERLNALMRREYNGDHLFDLAAIESTAPDGRRVSGSFEGQRYYGLYPGYAADAGHLNAEGSAVVAARLVRLVAATSRE